MENTSIISGISTSQLEAMLKNIMEQTGTNNPMEAAVMMGNGKLKVSMIEPRQKWQVEDGVIYLEVKASGLIEGEWIKFLKKCGYAIEDSAARIIKSPGIVSEAGTILKIAILRGDQFSNYKKLAMILAEAKERGFLEPSQEAACLIRLALSDEDIKKMGLLGIMTIHKNIKPYVWDGSYSWLCSASGLTDDSGKGYDFGYAFIVPK